MGSESDTIPAELLWVAEFGDRPPLFLAKALLDEGMSLTTVTKTEDWFRQPATGSLDLMLISVTIWNEAIEDFCRRFQDLLGRNAPPMIVISLPQSEPNFEAAFAIGVYDYLIRPMPWPLLRQRLNHAIQHHRALLQSYHLSGHGESLKYQLTQAKQRLAQSQRQDAITQLLNRTTFEESFELTWRLHIRERKVLSLIVIDLGYRDVAWDDVASAIAMDYLHRMGVMILDHLKRPGDLACRYQEKQILVLLPNTTLGGATQWLQLLERSWTIEESNASSLQRNLHPIWYHGIASQQPALGDSSEDFITAVKLALQRSQDRSRSHELHLPTGG